MPTYGVTKTYTPEQGLSATFRQWRAKSHCRFLHGYALGVRVHFVCHSADLDENGWVYNFGGLKAFKQFLADTFDHKTLVAKDDPALPLMRQLAGLDGVELGYRDIPNPHVFHAVDPLIQLVEVERTGCEAFAKLCYDWLDDNVDFEGRGIRIEYVEVFEHQGNSATYYG